MGRLAPLAVVLVLAACSGSSGPARSTSGPAPTSVGTTSPSTTPQLAGPCGQVATPPPYRHVVWIWMENHGTGAIIGSGHAPFINALARSCGLASNDHGIGHPSLPNYIAATSGLPSSQLSRFGGDCSPSASCSTDAASIFTQGETWRAYEESMPAACDRSNHGDYAVRHNPPPYFRTLNTCAGNDLPYPQLMTDLAAGTLPAFAFVTPNLQNDMHDGSVADGDRWLSANVPPLLASAAYRSGTTAVFITWDEGGGGNQVATLVISPSTRPETVSSARFDHYSLLATTEDLLRLPRLGQAASASTLTSTFNL